MALKVAISVPSGYNAREMLLPLRELLEADAEVAEVFVITPAAPFADQLFSTFSDKFSFHSNPGDDTGHAKLMQELQPDIVVTPTVGLDTYDTAIIRAAKKADIPTLTFIASWDNVFKMERLFKKGHSGVAKAAGDGYALPDYYALWNSLNAEHLQQIVPGLNPAVITITGPPRFDYFTHTDRIPTREDLWRYLELPSSKQKLIHGATTELYSFEYIIAALANAQKQSLLDPTAALYASVHPGGDIKKHEVYKKHGAIVRYSFGRRSQAPHPDFKYLPTDEETYRLIALFKHTDVLVNQSSTVAIESMVADTPVINVAYGKLWDWWKWYRSMVYRDFNQHYRYVTNEGGTTIVKSPRQLITSTNAYLENPTLHTEERRRTVKKLITHSDGTCSQRLLDVIKQRAS